MDFMEVTQGKLVPLAPRLLIERIAARWRGKSWQNGHGRPLLTVITVDHFSTQGLVVDIREAAGAHTMVFKSEAPHAVYQNDLVYIDIHGLCGNCLVSNKCSLLAMLLSTFRWLKL